MKRDTPPHTCHYMLTRTQSTDREYRACPVCGKEKPQEPPSEPCYFHDAGKNDRLEQRDQ